MVEHYQLEEGRTRALVVYLQHMDASAFETEVLGVLGDLEIDPDEASGAFYVHADELPDALNIALTYGTTRKRLKASGDFRDVCIGAFFYNQPTPPPEPEPDPDDPTELEEDGDDPEPPAPPSIPSLVCDKLAEVFPGSTFGASAFVVPASQLEYNIEVF